MLFFFNFEEISANEKQLIIFVIPGDLFTAGCDWGDPLALCGCLPPGDLKNRGSDVGTPSKYLGEAGSSLANLGLFLS